MSTQQVTFRAPAATDIEVEEERVDRTDVRDFTIRFRAFPDSDGNALYEYRGSRIRPIRTVGDLTANDIGEKRITLGTGEGRVEGVLGWVGSDVETDEIWAGARTVHFRKLCDVKVSITVGGVTLHGLDRDHPCEVIA